MKISTDSMMSGCENKELNHLDLLQECMTSWEPVEH